VRRRYDLEVQATHVKSVADPHLMHRSEIRPLQDVAEPCRHYHLRSTRDDTQGRQVQVIEVAVAYEDGINVREVGGGHSLDATPKRPQNMSQDRVREEPRPRHLDEDGRVTQKDQTVANRPVGWTGSRHVRSTSYEAG
jgi:hypothetical protein